MPPTELAREDGDEKRSVTLFESDEGIRLHSSDTGPTAQATFGAAEYEFWVDIARADLPALAAALLRERFAGDVRATEHVRAFCEASGVPHRWSSWTTL
jgi:hypothetical protein